MSKPSTFRPQVEALEPRNLLAAHITAQLVGSTLLIDGTAGNDYISVTQTAGKVSVYGTSITDGTAHPSSIDESGW